MELRARIALVPVLALALAGCPGSGSGNPVAPSIKSFAGTPATIVAGTPTAVTWNWVYTSTPSPAPSCAIDHGVGVVQPGDATTLTLDATTTYLLTCSSSAGSGNATTTITVTPAPEAPVLGSFTATPASVTVLAPTDVAWAFTFANAPTPAPACSIDNGVGTVASGDTTSVTLDQDTTYTLTCSNSAGSDTRTATVTTTPVPVAPSLSTFTATPSTVTANQATNVTWSWIYATPPTPQPTCTIDGSVGTVASGDTTSVTLVADQTFTLTCTNSAGSDSKSLVVGVTAAQIAPVITGFTATPSQIASGTPTPVTFTWSYTSTPLPAPTCTIDGGIGTVASGDTRNVMITADTTFTLTCTNSSGSSSAQATIAVTTTPAGTLTCPPIVNPDMASCPSYLGNNVVSLCTCDTQDQAVLSCNSGAHFDRTYCWTAPATGTFEFSLGQATTTAALGIFTADSSCTELGCDASGTAAKIDLAMTAGQAVYIVLEETSGSTSFTLSINQI